MSVELDRNRLSDLLIDPREDLSFEIKNWLDLKHNKYDKATFAKAVLALANHGGGYIALGLTETESDAVEAEGRPATFDGYGQDLINGIVQKYCEPSFHCAVHIVQNRAGAAFPIVVVPGRHRVPIQARCAGPNGNTVQKNAIYIRRLGPRSETPQNAQDWDGLLARCLHNRRDEMYGAIRDVITGAVPQVEQPPETPRLEKWIDSSRQRWAKLTEPLAAGTGPRLPYGRYCFAYEVSGERRQITPAQFPEVLSRSVVRHTGWPVFWYPTRDGIKPYQIDGAVECWLGGDTETRPEDRDFAHSDFWRINPDGLAFLLRGYQEDGMDNERPPVPPAKKFDITLPVWRAGEALLHARSLATNLFERPTTINFVAIYEGLAGRSLVSVDNSRDFMEGRTARQNNITLKTHINVEAIDPNLPEIVQPLLSPLYSLFDFFELPMQLVATELTRMRAGNY
jgi:transcriptional regulator with XRE-family HTH domain